MRRFLLMLLLVPALLSLGGCPQLAGDGEPDPGAAPLVDIATLLATPGLHGQPVRLQGQILSRDQVSSPYYLESQWGYNALQYCGPDTLVFDDGTGALQFTVDETFADNNAWLAFITPLIGQPVEITAVWPDLTGISLCAAVCYCDPKLVITSKADIVL